MKVEQDKETVNSDVPRGARTQQGPKTKNENENLLLRHGVKKKEAGKRRHTGDLIIIPNR